MKSFVNLRSITILVIVSAAVMGTDGTSERGDGGRNPPQIHSYPDVSLHCVKTNGALKLYTDVSNSSVFH